MTADSKSDYVSELIYHVKRSIIDFAVDPSGSTQTTDILSTFTDLTAAKAAAHTALLQEGYLKNYFAKYEENDGTEKWKHEDATMVIARAPAGQEFKVSLDTTLNKFPFRVDPSSKVIDHLEYVLQTTIYYNHESTGSIQTTQVEGVYPTRKTAREAATRVLLDDSITKKTFAEYDEHDNESKDWPYGEDVLIHAVAETGENFQVSVKPQPRSHQQHISDHNHL